MKLYVGWDWLGYGDWNSDGVNYRVPLNIPFDAYIWHVEAKPQVVTP